MNELVDIPDFSDNERQIAEEVLTELLVMALTIRPALRAYITNLCEGVAHALPPEAVERSRDYASLRVKQLSST